MTVTMELEKRRNNNQSMTIVSGRTTDMKNPTLKKIADECGLYIDPHNLEISYKEVEFFGERIVKRAISMIEKQGWPSEWDEAAHSIIGDIKKEFNLS